jgi:hypothetical protein
VKELFLRPDDDPIRNRLSFLNPIQITFTQGDAHSSLPLADFLEHGSHTSGRKVIGWKQKTNRQVRSDTAAKIAAT